MTVVYDSEQMSDTVETFKHIIVLYKPKMILAFFLFSVLYALKMMTSPYCDLWCFLAP